MKPWQSGMAAATVRWPGRACASGTAFARLSRRSGGLRQDGMVRRG